MCEKSARYSTSHSLFGPAPTGDTGGGFTPLLLQSGKSLFNPTAHKAPLPSSRVCRLATTLIELTCPPSLARWRSRLFNKAARKMHSRYIVVVAVAFAIQRRQSLPLTC